MLALSFPGFLRNSWEFSSHSWECMHHTAHVTLPRSQYLVHGWPIPTMLGIRSQDLDVIRHFPGNPSERQSIPRFPPEIRSQETVEFLGIWPNSWEYRPQKAVLKTHVENRSPEFATWSPNSWELSYSWEFGPNSWEFRPRVGGSSWEFSINPGNYAQPPLAGRLD